MCVCEREETNNVYYVEIISKKISSYYIVYIWQYNYRYSECKYCGVVTVRNRG